MHADALYHRMLDQEKAQKAAEEAGLPIPQFPPIIPKPRSATPSPTTSIPSSLPSPIEPEAAAQSKRLADAVGDGEKAAERDYLTPEARAELEKRIKDQPQAIKELEEKAMRAEAESDAAVGKKVSAILGSGKEKRQERREKGEATVGDTVSGWFGW